MLVIFYHAVTKQMCSDFTKTYQKTKVLQKYQTYQKLSNNQFKIKTLQTKNFTSLQYNSIKIKGNKDKFKADH